MKGAINKILAHNGCILADSVGLGKTYSALAIIKYFELKNERVLVLCPKKFRENWTAYKLNDQLNPFVDDRYRYDVLCHTDLSRERGFSGDINLETLNWGNYDLVVIDESHNFRNNIPGKKDENGNIIRRRGREMQFSNIGDTSKREFGGRITIFPSVFLKCNECQRKGREKCNADKIKKANEDRQPNFFHTWRIRYS